MKFTLIGKIKPYVRMTRRSKWVNKEAIAYNSNQVELKARLQAAMSAAGYDPIPARTPFAVHILITMPGRLHCQDLDNQIKAVLDACQHVVFPDDRWMDNITADRVLGDKHQVELFIRHRSQEN